MFRPTFDPRRSFLAKAAWLCAVAGPWGCAANEPTGQATGSSAGGYFSDVPAGSGGATGTGSSASTSSGGAGVGVGGTEGGLSARVWRLSHEQYARSILALLGVEPDMSGFAPESGNGVYSNFSSTALVNEDLADNYFDVAIEIAETLPAAKLGALTSCSLSEICLDAFISELGTLAFRSSVPEEVTARLTAIFDLAAAESGTEWGFRAVLAAIVSSPLFLYRKEIGPNDDSTSPVFELTGDQISELLAFSLLGTPPPKWLTETLRDGELTQEHLASVLERLVAEPAFEAELTHFLSEWLEVHHFDSVEKFEESFPGFDEAKPWIRQEFDAFIAQSGRSDSGLAELLLDPVPAVSNVLTTFYYSDPSAPPRGSAERLGVLGLGSTLASHAKSYLTSPTLRGTFIRKRFFCQEITLPPDFTPPPLSETEAKGQATTTRELYEQHLSNPSCNTCHRLTDNLGFALEAFDGAGRFRTEDSTQGRSVPLDLATELTDSDVDRPLGGARDLAQALSESIAVRECFARQAFRFYFGLIEPHEDMSAILGGAERLTAADSIQQMAIGLLSTTDTFHRTREISP